MSRGRSKVVRRFVEELLAQLMQSLGEKFCGVDRITLQGSAVFEGSDRRQTTPLFRDVLVATAEEKTSAETKKRRKKKASFRTSDRSPAA
jgi:hypothetical protein